MCQLCMQSAAVNWPADHAVGSTAVTEHAGKGKQSTNTRCRAVCHAMKVGYIVMSGDKALDFTSCYISTTQTHTSSGIYIIVYFVYNRT